MMQNTANFQVAILYYNHQKKGEDFCPRFSFSNAWRTKSCREAPLRAGNDVFGFASETSAFSRRENSWFSAVGDKPIEPP